LSISARERGKRDDGCEIEKTARFYDAMLQASSFVRRRWRVGGLGCRGGGRRSGRWAVGAVVAWRVWAGRFVRPWWVGCMELHGCKIRGMIDVKEGGSDGGWGRICLSERKDNLVERDMS
jgi:hypothetical protein